MANPKIETTDVVIAGCGPTGAMLSGYLGQMGIKNVVLEKEADITTDPRGIALDEDGIRLLQGLGIYDKIYSEIGTCMNKFLFIGGAEKTLDKSPFMQFNYDTTEGGTGHVAFICHKQPVMEYRLRKVMEASTFCELRSSCEVNEISEDDQWTYCQYTDSTGTQQKIRSRFFVGADGKTGFTRKQYLEPRGVKLERAHNMFYEESWVALNMQMKLPTPATHPDFALWAKGYSPEDVYDLFFPKDFRFICNPGRPAVCGRFGPQGGQERLWRYEYVVKKDEDGLEMAKEENLKKIIYPYLTHAGKRYGLADDVQYPDDCITVLRSRPFLFSARSCNRWAQDRVILCGDAAHVFPPFGGQGIASGFRDAASLAWRLTLLCRAPSTNLDICNKVLTAWYKERQQQLEKSLAATIENGEFVNESDPLKLFARTWYFWCMSWFPSWRKMMSLGQRREGMIQYKFQNGMPFMPEFGGGACMPQVFCKTIESKDAKISFTDDIIFKQAPEQGLFTLFVYLKTLDDLSSAKTVIEDIDAGLLKKFAVGHVTYLVEEVSQYAVAGVQDDLSSMFAVASGDDFAASPLCKGRPFPYFYDPKRLGREIGWKRFVVVRPDRFLFAACDSGEDLRKVLTTAAEFLY